MEDIELHTDEFFAHANWAGELARVIDEPNYVTQCTEQDDLTMMMMVHSQMAGFQEQWHETELTTKQLIFAVSQLIMNNRATREQAERAVSEMIGIAREAHRTGTTPQVPEAQ